MILRTIANKVNAITNANAVYLQSNNTKQYFGKKHIKRFDEKSQEIFVLLEEDFKRNNPQGRLCSEEIAV